MVYEWKDGSRVKAKAQEVGEELERIEYKDAENVVEAARKSNGELHKCFEWNDAKAGQEYRKEQARYILRMIVTEVESKESGETVIVRVRAFESVRFAVSEGSDDAEKTMTYIPIREVLGDKAMREQVIGRLMTTIAEAERTAETYSHIAPELKKTRKKLHEAGETLR
jgi:hypothetical protein